MSWDKWEESKKTKKQGSSKKRFALDVREEAFYRLQSKACSKEVRNCDPTDLKFILAGKYGEFEDYSMKIAEVIAKEFGHFVLLINEKGVTGKELDLYYYKDGIYKPDGKTEIEFIINDLLGVKTNATKRGEILAQIVYHMPRIPHNEFEDDKKFICCKNGVLNIEDLKLLPHDPQMHFLTKIPVNWNPKGECPRFKRFLKEVLMSRKKRDLLVQEMVGLTLYRGVVKSNPAFFVLKGGGRNGKSTLIEAIEALLGEDNHMSASLTQILSDNDTKAKLYGKLANLGSECKTSSDTQLDFIKQVTSGDAIQARGIYSASFKFKPYSTLIFAFNEMPVFKERSKAVLSRIHLIEFPNDFDPKGEGTIQNMLELITTEGELEGIFVFAVKGLKRVIDRGYFTRIEDNDEVAQIMEDDIESVNIFSDERLEYSDGESIEVNALYNEYRSWCRSMSIMPENKNTFGKKLLALNERRGGVWDSDINPCCKVDRIRPRVNGERKVFYVNIRIKRGGQRGHGKRL